ncbi:MAG: hypothetical protein AB7K64_22020 [Variibacter sp.]
MIKDILKRCAPCHTAGGAFFGYGHILKNFVPRLRTHGLGERQLRTLLVDNPRRVFSVETVASPAAAH